MMMLSLLFGLTGDAVSWPNLWLFEDRNSGA